MFTILPRPALEHPAPRELTQPKEAAKIHVEHGVPIGFRKVDGRCAANRAGVVDEDVDALELRERRADELFGGRSHAEVALQGQRLSAVGAHGFCVSSGARLLPWHATSAPASASATAMAAPMPFESARHERLLPVEAKGVHRAAPLAGFWLASSPVPADRSRVCTFTTPTSDLRPRGAPPSSR